MSRHRAQSSYGHRINKLCVDTYRVYWTVDRYINGSRLRYPTTFSKDMDEKGAIKFSKRWGIEFEAPREG